MTQGLSRDSFTRKWYRGYVYELRYNGLVYQVVIPSVRATSYCDVIEDCENWAKTIINKIIRGEI